MRCKAVQTFALLAWGALAAAPAGADEALPVALEDAVAKLVPGVEPDQVRQSPLPGLYEVAFGPTVVYVSADGRYLLRGDVIDLESRQNLTEASRREARADTVAKLGEDSMIVFAPRQVKHSVTVFTDVDCPYCQKMHREMEGYLEEGIEIRYTAFPRAGVGSRTYDEMVSVWCADDAQQAMAAAKAGEHVAPRQCPNPVERHYELGRALGVRGTPTIVTESGDMIPGYLPPARLAQRLESEGG